MIIRHNYLPTGNHVTPNQGTTADTTAKSRIPKRTAPVYPVCVYLALNVKKIVEPDCYKELLTELLCVVIGQ